MCALRCRYEKGERNEALGKSKVDKLRAAWIAKGKVAEGALQDLARQPHTRARARAGSTSQVK